MKKWERELWVELLRREELDQDEELPDGAMSDCNLWSLVTAVAKRSGTCEAMLNAYVDCVEPDLLAGIEEESIHRERWVEDYLDAQ